LGFVCAVSGLREAAAPGTGAGRRADHRPARAAGADL